MATTYGLEQDFLDHLKGNKVLGMNGIGADVSCPFIPFHVLREYWTETRIKEFLGACGVSTIGWRTVQRSYLKVLSTLVVIREGAWIGLFLKNGVDDVRFPFFPLAHPPHFLAGVPFLNSFYTAQWQFWALDFETEVLMHDRKLEKEQILPIIEKKTLKEGRGSSGATSLVVLHEDYNHLFDQVRMVPAYH